MGSVIQTSEQWIAKRKKRVQVGSDQNGETEDTDDGAIKQEEEEDLRGTWM